MGEYQTHKRIAIERGQHLTVSEHSVSGEHPLHWHSFFEIEILLSGEGVCIVNDVEYCFPQHRVFCLSPTDFHAIRAKGEVRLLNISFDETMTDEKRVSPWLFASCAKAYAVRSEEYERLVSAASLLRHECESEGECQRQLLQYIAHRIFQSAPNEPSVAEPMERTRGIRKALTYMELHFRENLTLAELAAEAGYHPTYFSELIKRVTGESYIETLTRLRLAHARTLLANDFSVSDACFLSGFGSISQFFTVFKRQFGLSPGEYRAKERRSHS